MTTYKDLLEELHRTNQSEESQLADSRSTKLSLQSFEKIAEWVFLHKDEKINLDDLIHFSKLSLQELYILFRNHSRLTPMQFIRMVREYTPIEDPKPVDPYALYNPSNTLFKSRNP